jgi:hypothetical protein
MFRVVFAIFALLSSGMPAVAKVAPTTAPRLSDISKFPPDLQDAVFAVTEKIEKAGMKPGEYYAEISREGSVLHIWLRHESHDADLHSRGDSCGKCRTVDYDLIKRTIGPIHGIR